MITMAVEDQLGSISPAAATAVPVLVVAAGFVFGQVADLPIRADEWKSERAVATAIIGAELTIGHDVARVVQLFLAGFSSR
ncbi:hypothetical protein [Amycolatopsis sp. NBRC 101858]|uniref:hypothetical protein n=1 Tax=Amycolatopsis sp. NBRC 101858 TaxID=3032200 RepID=UPI00255570B2|nr:hypothetical protein [Amycolatopsis sp. NBRC 101858]